MNPEIYGKYHKSKKYNEMLPDYFKPEHRLVEVCNKFRQTQCGIGKFRFFLNIGNLFLVFNMKF